MSKSSSRSSRRLVAIAATIALAGTTLLFAGSASATSVLKNQWKFDITSPGETATDNVGGINGNANPGSGANYPQPSSDVPYTSPANPGSAQFDGQNYYEIGNPLSADFTICAWIKTASRGNDWHFLGANIVDAESGGFALDYGFGINSAGALMFGNGGNIIGSGDADANVMGVKVVADNAWHHVCVSRNNTTGEDILYVDGAQDATGITGVGLLTSNSLARIGSGFDGNAPFVGNIDDLRFFTEVVTPAEIAEIFSPTPAEEESTPTEPEVTYMASGALADTGTALNPSVYLGLLLMVSGSGVALVARARRK